MTSYSCVIHWNEPQSSHRSAFMLHQSLWSQRYLLIIALQVGVDSPCKLNFPSKCSMGGMFSSILQICFVLFPGLQLENCSLFFVSFISICCLIFFIGRGIWSSWKEDCRRLCGRLQWNYFCLVSFTIITQLSPYNWSCFCQCYASLQFTDHQQWICCETLIVSGSCWATLCLI